ncbi:MAG: glycosyltransferase [Pontibacterium sp.]
MISFKPFKQQHRPPKDSYYPRVAVVLGFYNGNKYLKEQVTSILEQRKVETHLFISDDCSPEHLDIDALDLKPDQQYRVYIGKQPDNKGFAKNFLLSATCIPPEFEYIAFSDQDDIWELDKLERAVSKMDAGDPKTPCLYCSQVTAFSTCETDTPFTFPKFQVEPSFRHALVQSIAPGCTMVLNQPAIELIKKAVFNVKSIPAHDWTCYQLVTGVGGQVFLDQVSKTRYRQHENNQIGANRGLQSLHEKLNRLRNKKLRHWNKENIELISMISEQLTHDNRKCFHHFTEASNSLRLLALLHLFKSKVYRATRLDTFALYIAALLGRA